MGKLIRYLDDKTGCWSRVKFANGDLISIQVTQAGVMVKSTWWGFMWDKLYNETNMFKIAVKVAALEVDIGQYTTPKEITFPPLRVLTQVALECNSAAELSIQLNKKPHKSIGSQEVKERRAQVIKDFGSYIEHHAIGIDIRDVSELPHPKKEILDAIEWEIFLDTNAKKVDALSIVAILLANFQENVGSKTLTPFGITTDELCTGDESNVSELDEQKNQELRAYIHSPDKEKYDSLYKIVQQERKDIRSDLSEIEELKKDILENT